MENTKMNRQLGTKWFTFYTRIRPCLACVTSVTIFVDFFTYMDVYFGYWWMLLYLVTSIAQPVLSIMVFVKSSGDYVSFVRFVKAVLILEIINMAYQSGVRQYINSFEIWGAIIIALVIFAILYFAWFRTNIKYFERRIVKEVPETVNCDLGSFPRQPQSSYSNEIFKTYENSNDYGVMTQNNTVLYCRKCGNKLIPNSVFCNKCGFKIDRF